MIMEMCALFDAATHMYGRPFFVVHTAQAVRGFRDAILKGERDDDVAKHPDDFSLYYLGRFDDNSGRFELLQDHQLLARGKDVKEAQS
ncbi:MAG: nonstructural protein [Microviridae sp.]|nr:MAG: nonstructural protein [Microviridae sp.]